MIFSRGVETVNVIELSSICNMSCEYCPCRLQGAWREVGFMEMSTFHKTLEIVNYFHKRGSQREVCLYMFGEPLLHPHLIECVRQLRSVLPRYIPVWISTNGIGMTTELANTLHDVGVSMISLSDHDARVASLAIIALKKSRAQWKPWRGAVWEPNNYAGLVEWVPPSDVKKTPCDWFIKGMCAVLSDGRITTCCNDAKGVGVIGDVNTHPADLYIRPYELCIPCHQEMPSPYNLFKSQEKRATL